MRVAVKQKGKTELTYVEPKDILLGEATLETLIARLTQLEDAYKVLINKLTQNTTLIQKGDTVEINGKLEQVDTIQVFVENIEKPLKFYKIEEGQLVLDPKKVGIII